MKLKLKNILIFFLVVALIALAILGIRHQFYYGKVRMNYPSAEEFPIQGIDVSHHQGIIDWQLLAEDEVDFAYIKATEGGDHVDSLFTNNWEKCNEAMIQRGAYHFYRLCKTGKEQAEHFMSVVPIDKDALPPAIDLEFGANCETTMNKNEILNEIRTYLNLISEHYQKKPVIYATQEFYQEFLKNEFTNYPIWIRDIYGRPKLIDGRPWTFWQYANRGSKEGIKGFVDLNVYAGKDLKELK